MGKWALLHRSERRKRSEQREFKKEQQKEGDEARKPKQVAVERPLTPEERNEIARMHLKDRGIEEPRTPAEVCTIDHYHPLDTTDLLEGAKDGANTLDMATFLFSNPVAKLGVQTVGAAVGMVGKIVSENKRIEECLERRELDYKKHMSFYKKEFDYELSKVPESEKRLETVTSNDPRHPSYVKPVDQSKLGPNTGSGGNWGFNFYSNGHTHGSRATYRW